VKSGGGSSGVVHPGQHSWYSNPAARRWRCEPPSADPQFFHASLPGYRPTELAEVPALADELDVGRLFVKDESGRLSLGAFKVLGASWAVARMLAGTAEFPDFTKLRLAAARSPVELVTATDGNHGRAVAYMARLLGLPARVFIPDAAPASASARIAAEGATVTVVSEPYDAAVELAARYADAEPGRALVQDTAWPGYEQVPGWIVAGYETLFSEIGMQLQERGVDGLDLLSVPVGVGSLAQAAVAHCRSRPPGSGAALAGPAVLAVEPATAACLLACLRTGAYGSIETDATVMAGLNCGTPSSLAWPVLAAGLDAAIAVPDQAATKAVADLVTFGVSAGPSGAASLAGARAALTGGGSAERRADLGVTESSVVVLLNTEGAS
jgi:diaminopropionate ammonia-lyase